VFVFACGCGAAFRALGQESAGSDSQSGAKDQTPPGKRRFHGDFLGGFGGLKEKVANDQELRRIAGRAGTSGNPRG
jgi:hypothetical protein